MLDTGFLMAMGGIGISLAGFAGLFSVLGDHDAASPVYRWRLRQIVITSFQLSFVAFGAIALGGFIDDAEVTARIVSAAGALLFVVGVMTAGRPGPAWPDERDRRWANGATLVWAAIMGVNVIVGSEPYVRVVLLILLLSPVLTFVRAVYDNTAVTAQD